MPQYHSQGKFPHKRHTVYRKPDGNLYAEELVSSEGFSNIYSLIYHCHPPTLIKNVGESFSVEPKITYQRHLKHESFIGFDVKPEKDFLLSRKHILVNNDLNICLAAPQDSMKDYFYKNADSDEVLFVHIGSGVLKTIYAPDIYDTLYTVSKEESFHCIKVLRLHIDDTVNLTDGKGNFYSATIIDDNPKGCSVKVIETIHDYGKRNFHLHIAIAPTKNIDRFEWFLEKATEIGIDEITPLICSHSERKVVKPERMEKIIISAMKQSMKTYLPKLNEATSFKVFINKDKSGQKFVANLPGDAGTHLKTKYIKGNDAVILIGPEGDFSPEEIADAIKKDYQSISLGRYRLRTETAGIVACHTINLLNDI